MTETPPPISTRVANLPRPIGQAINRALSKDPTARHQSAMQFYSEMEALATEPQPKSRVTGTTSSGTMGVNSAQRLRIAAAAISVVVIVLAGLIWASTHHSDISSGPSLKADHGSTRVTPPATSPVVQVSGDDRLRAAQLTDQAEQAAKKGQLSVAEELLKQGIAADPKYFNALLDMCAVLYGEKRYKEARTYWQQAKEVNATDNMVNYWDNKLRGTGF